jgi:hypothetical protein
MNGFVAAALEVVCLTKLLGGGAPESGVAVDGVACVAIALLYLILVSKLL